MRGWAATHWLSQPVRCFRTPAQAAARPPSSGGALRGALPRRSLRPALACASREMTTATAAQVARLVAAPTVCATSSLDASDRMINLSSLRGGAAGLSSSYYSSSYPSSSSPSSSSSSSSPPYPAAVGSCGVCAGFWNARLCAGFPSARFSAGFAAAAASARHVRPSVSLSDHRGNLTRLYSPPSHLPPHPIFSHSFAIATSSSTSSRVAAAPETGETTPPTTGELFVSLEELIQEAMEESQDLVFIDNGNTENGAAVNGNAENGTAVNGNTENGTAVVAEAPSTVPPVPAADAGEKSVPYLSPKQFENVLAAYNEAQPITTTVKTMTVSELNAALSSNDQLFVLDVRSPEEYAQGHVPSAVNIPLATVVDMYRGGGVPKDASTLAVICAKGGRSAKAALALQESEGLTNVISVAGGTIAWIEEGFPVKQAPKDITVHQLKDSLASPNPPFVIDVRSPEEYKDGHVPGAVNVPLGTVVEAVEKGEVDIGDREVAVICAKGGRSAKAVSGLKDSPKLLKLLNVTGGTSAWIEAGFPVDH